MFMGLILVLMAIPMTVLSQPSRVIGGNQNERANVIVRSINPVNGYVMAGRTNSFGPGTPSKMNALIVRTNQDGIPINAVITNGLQDEEATSMVRTSDNCYVVAGWTCSYNPTGSPNADIFVIKLKEDLSTLWAKVYHMKPNDFSHRAFSIIEVSSQLGGGYALTGSCNYAGNALRIIVLRLDVNGELPNNNYWVHTYSIGNNNLYNVGLSITEVRDASAPNVRFAVAGYAAPNANAMGNAFVMRLGSNGTSASIPMGTNIFIGENNEMATSVVWDGSGNDPGIVAAGWTTSVSPGTPAYANVWAAKIKAVNPPNSTSRWSYVYRWPIGSLDRNDQVWGDKSLIVTTPGTASGYALSGLTYSRGPNASNAPNLLLIRLNYNGTVGWNGMATVHPRVAVPQNRFDEAYGMVQTTGGGFAVVGRTNSFTPPPPNLAGYNFLFTTFAGNGTQPSCADQYSMQYIRFTWTTQNATTFTNAMDIKRFDVIPWQVNSQPVCN
jgi:hypothetical protein